MAASDDDLDFSNLEGFDWDEANINKSWLKHKVHYKDSEEVFANKPLLVSENIKHSKTEKRFQCLGKTDSERRLFISFTLRGNKIRVISARPQSRYERRKYEKAEKA